MPSINLHGKEIQKPQLFGNKDSAFYFLALTGLENVLRGNSRNGPLIIFVMYPNLRLILFSTIST